MASVSACFLCSCTALCEALQEKVAGRGANLGEVRETPQPRVGDGSVMCRSSTVLLRVRRNLWTTGLLCSESRWGKQTIKRVFWLAEIKISVFTRKLKVVQHSLPI